MRGYRRILPEHKYLAGTEIEDVLLHFRQRQTNDGGRREGALLRAGLSGQLALFPLFGPKFVLPSVCPLFARDANRCSFARPPAPAPAF